MIFQLRCRNLGTSSTRDFRASTSIQNVCTKTHTCRFVGDATIFLIVALHLGCCWTWFETVYRERPQYQALKSDVSYVESWSLYFLIYFCFTWFSLVHSFIFLYSSAVIVLLMCLSFFFFVMKHGVFMVIPTKITSWCKRDQLLMFPRIGQVTSCPLFLTNITCNLLILPSHTS